MDIFKEDKIMTAISYINLLLISFCIVGCIYGVIVTKNIFYSIEALVEVAALVLSIVYFVKGYKKDAAKYYKSFMLLQASTFVIEYAFSTFIPSVDTSGIYEAFSLILYGNTLLLAVAKDLGKKVTISLASFNLVVYTFTFIGSFFEAYPTPIAKTDSILMTTTWFSLAGITLLMTIAKYIDKEKRNTK